MSRPGNCTSVISAISACTDIISWINSRTEYVGEFDGTLHELVYVRHLDVATLA